MEGIHMTENIEVFTQSSIRITDRDKHIYIDPFQFDGEPKDASCIFITHDHYDHFSPEDIRKVAGEHTVLVLPETMKDRADEVSDVIERVMAVKPGIYYEINGHEFDTVAAYNVIKPFHPKSSEWVGYILRVDGRRIYIAGDTDITKENKAVACDIALVPIGGTYTMDAKKAAELVNTIRPAAAIPTHYGSIVGKPGDGEVFAANVKEPIKVELKLKF
jgi:L-ascorbate metabolism protein UlaG (beta-lactamase superfamily)